MGPEQKEDAYDLTINVHTISRRKDALACTRILASDVVEYGYVTFKSAVDNLSTPDLINLLNIAISDKEEVSCHFLLYCMVLSLGDGNPSFSNNSVSKVYERGFDLLTTELMSRLGEIGFHRDKASILCDFDNSWVYDL